MDSLFVVFTVLVVTLMLPNIYRGVMGPTVFDQILGIGLMGSKTVIAIMLIGLSYDHLDFFIDCALTYCLLNFVGVLMASKYFIRGGVEEGK